MIGKGIEYILNNTASIYAITQGRVYSISNNDEDIPSIYYRVSIVPQYTKNGVSMQDWKVTILTMCKGYADSWELAFLIREAFDANRGKTIENILFKDVICTGMADDYEFNIDTYGQQITFDIRTDNCTSSENLTT
jgi:hypothetical protein